MREFSGEKLYSVYAKVVPGTLWWIKVSLFEMTEIVVIVVVAESKNSTELGISPACAL